MREMKLWFLKLDYPKNTVDQGRLNFLNHLEELAKEIKVCSELPHITHYLKTSVGLFIDILIYFILIKKLKEFLHLVPWFRLAVQGKLAAI